MAIRERLVYAIDVVTDGANRGLANFRQSVSQAEGVTGKFKAGASSAFDTVQANAGALALGAGAALATFGAKAVENFTTGALAAGKFSDASGLAVEDASRWAEVANDLGVPTETMATNFLKLEQAIATGKPAVKELGIEVVKTADGTADMNATMLDAIERLGGIKDPAERAQAATELFGRGFAQTAEIVLGDADDIKKRLAEVADAQVFDPDEVKNARELRDSIDNVKDKFEALSLELGGALAPAIADVADSLTELVEIADAVKVPELLKFGVENTALNRARQFGEEIGSWFGAGGKADEEGAELFHAAIREIADATADAIQAAHDHKAAVEGGNAPISLMAENAENAAEALAEKAEWDDKAAEAAARHEEALEAVAEAMEAQRDAALDLVGGDIAVREAQRRAAEAAEELNTVLADQETSLGEAGAAIDEAADAHLNAASAAAEYRAKQMEANGQTVDANTKALLLKEELQNLVGQLDGPLAAALQNYIDQLGAIPKTVGTTIVLNRPGRVGDFAAPVFGGKFDSGGVVPGPRGAERMILAHGGETVLPTHKAGATGASGGVVINAYITANDGESVFDKLAREVRAKGPGPVRRALGID